MVHDYKSKPKIESNACNYHNSLGSLECEIEEEPIYVILPPRAKTLSPRLQSRLSHLTKDEWDFIVRRHDLYEGTPVLAAKSLPYTSVVIATVWKLSGKTTASYNPFRI